MTKNMLLEIGAEELPASYIEPARTQITELMKKYLDQHCAAYQNVMTFATPRRLAVIVEKLEDKTKGRFEEFSGPTVSVGRDANGNFTQAAVGFAGKHNLKPEKLEVVKKDKGEYFCVRKDIPGEKIENVLRIILPDIISKLYFPKTMIWEPSAFRFARPIRTIMALYGDKTIKFSLAGVKSGDYTFGLHTVSRKKISVSSAEKYLSSLKNNCVIADPGERKETLKKIIESTAKRIKGGAIMDEGLIDEVNYLVEHPVAVLGSFDGKYLKLPREILVNCMKKKQKYFALTSSREELLNSFIGIRNGMSENQEVVRAGYERVLSARLSDAEFFFKQDTRTALYSKLEKLKGVMFHEKLGTVYEKIARVRELALHISGLLEKSSAAVIDKSALERACELSKADLVTEMVFEYPELQGVIGRIYAQFDKEPPEVSKAVEEHYWPLNLEDKIPSSDLGVVIALSDKIDTIAGYFAAGLIPSGSQDPYGLRRISAGIIKIIRERKLAVSLKDIVEKGFSLMEEKTGQKTQEKKQLMEFFRQRLENVLESQGYRFDEVRAVTACGFDDLPDVDSRIAALKKLRSMADFESLAAAFKRAANILRQARKSNYDTPQEPGEDLLKEETEKNLYLRVKKIEAELKELFEKKDYENALMKMVSIKPDVDAFFEKVMVMAQDVELRSNRLALLNYIANLFFKILDFSMLQN